MANKHKKNNPHRGPTWVGTRPNRIENKTQESLEKIKIDEMNQELNNYLNDKYEDYEDYEK